MNSLKTILGTNKLIISIVLGIILWLAFRHIDALASFIIWIGIADIITHSLQSIVHNTLLVFGIDNHCYGVSVCITGARGMNIIYGCLGLSHFALFTGLVFGYSGKWVHKAWYIPSGMIFLHLLNALRLVILSFALKYAPSYDEQVHYWATRIIMYSGILTLWIIWIIRFSKK